MEHEVMVQTPDRKRTQQTKLTATQKRLSPNINQMHGQENESSVTQSGHKQKRIHKTKAKR